MNKKIIGILFLALQGILLSADARGADLPSKRTPLADAIKKDARLARAKFQRMVQFRRNSKLSLDDQMKLIRDSGGRIIRRIEAFNIFVVDFPVAPPESLMKNADIEKIQEDGYAGLDMAMMVEGCAPPLNATNYCQSFDEESQLESKENYETKWGIDHIRAMAVWETPSIGANYPVKVCIIDSGIDTSHPELTHAFKGGMNFSADTDEPNSDVEDRLGHGTHVAGIIAAARDGEGMVGVAPENAELYVARVFGDSDWTTTSAVIAGIGYCVQMNAQVINMSLYVPYDPLLEAAVRIAYESDAVLVASTGNDGSTEIHFPAAFEEEVIAVAASDEEDGWASFSNHGPEVDLMAPGAGIYSAFPLDLGGPYSTETGTSMAVPFVSGVVALIRGFEPRFTASQVEDILLNGTQDVGFSEDEQGRGLLQACSALQQASWMKDEYLGEK